MHYESVQEYWDDEMVNEARVMTHRVTVPMPEWSESNLSMIAQGLTGEYSNKPCTYSERVKDGRTHTVLDGQAMDVCIARVNTIRQSLESTRVNQAVCSILSRCRLDATGRSRSIIIKPLLKIFNIFLNHFNLIL